MKVLLTITLMFYSTLALTCPELAGNFICGYKDSGEPNLLTIQQNLNKFLILLPGSQANLEVAADGKPYHFETEDSIIDFSNSCTTTDMVMKFDLFSKNESLKLDSSTVFSTLNERQIKFYMNQVITKKDSTTELKITLLCTKN